MSDKAREESAVTGPERPPEDDSLAEEVIGPAGWGPESSDPELGSGSTKDEEEQDEDDAGRR